MLKNFIIISLFCFLNQFSKAGNNYSSFIYVTSDEKCYLLNETGGLSEIIFNKNENRPNPLLQIFRAKQKKNKRITAAVLAFPFPFGIVGLHRIYLGCAPYVPVVYIASLGGAFGILPFIDFCALVLDKDIDGYINNQKVFMWVK